MFSLFCMCVKEQKITRKVHTAGEECLSDEHYNEESGDEFLLGNWRLAEKFVGIL